MEKLYLVVHNYTNIEPALYVFKEDGLTKNFIESTETKKVSIFEYDFEKIKSVLSEVEVKTVIQNK